MLLSSLHVLSQRLSALSCRVVQRRPDCSAHLVVLQTSAQAVQYLLDSLQRRAIPQSSSPMCANFRQNFQSKSQRTLSALQWTGMSVDSFQRVTSRFHKRQCSQRGQSGRSEESARPRCGQVQPCPPSRNTTYSTVVTQEQNRPQLLLRLHRLSGLRLGRLLGAYYWRAVNRCSNHNERNPCNSRRHD